MLKVSKLLCIVYPLWTRELLVFMDRFYVCLRLPLVVASSYVVAIRAWTDLK